MSEYSKEIKDLLDVLMSAYMYIEFKSIPKNPYVRNLSEGKDETELFDILKMSIAKAKYLMPEVEAMIEERESDL